MEILTFGYRRLDVWTTVVRWYALILSRIFAPCWGSIDCCPNIAVEQQLLPLLHRCRHLWPEQCLWFVDRWQDICVDTWVYGITHCDCSTCSLSFHQYQTALLGDRGNAVPRLARGFTAHLRRSGCLMNDSYWSRTHARGCQVITIIKRFAHKNVRMTPSTAWRGMRLHGIK